MKQWISKKSEFDSDGSLRDIYVFDTDQEQWNCFIREISQSKYKYEFWHGDVKAMLPHNWVDIKKLDETGTTTLRIFLEDDIQVNCHFFIEDEIEMDVSPKDIKSASDYQELTSFLNWLSSVTNSTVYLTHENAPGKIILSVNSKDV